MTTGFSRIAAFFMALLTALFGVGPAQWTNSGCRWADANVPGGDGDHVMLTVSDDGVHWKRHLEAPCSYSGKKPERKAGGRCLFPLQKGWVPCSGSHLSVLNLLFVQDERF